MARCIRLRRGTAPQHETFTGAMGEITVDTTNNTIRVHDGQTLGGTALAKRSEIPDLSGVDYVIAWQTPSAANNFTWYRKYKSGWVEQGGSDFTPRTINAGTGTAWYVTLPVPMSDTNYNIQISFDNGNLVPAVNNNKQTSTTQVYLGCKNQSTGNVTSQVQYWRVSGFIA